MNEKNTYSQAMDEMARFLSGEMDEPQKFAYQQKLDNDPDLRKEFLEMETFWNKLDFIESASHHEIDTDTAWQKLNHRFKEPKDEKVIRVRPLLQPATLVKWAAAILIIAGLGWLSYFYAWQPGKSDLLVFENADDQLTSVKALHDGSVVYLSQKSQIHYPEFFDAHERSILLTGQAFFDVAPDQQKPFRVKAGNTQIEVLGTSFNVKMMDENNMELFVETGKVNVSFGHENIENVLVEAGQLFTLNNGKMEMKSYPAYDTQWRKNLIQLKDEKLGDILYVLGKTFGFSMNVEDEHLKNRIMTLTVYDSSLKTISEIIALSLSVDYELLSDDSVIFSTTQ